MKVAMIGAGAYGLALGDILQNKGVDVAYFDPKIECKDLNTVISNAEYIVIAIPSSSLSELIPCLPQNSPIIITSKGILDPQIFESLSDWMVLSGPGFAIDFEEHNKMILTITDERIRPLFETSYLTFDYTDDKKGVLMCGALKNVYAILAGFWELQKETPSWERFVELAAQEMADILVANSASSDTVKLACGIGDLRLTSSLPSRNYEYGMLSKTNSEFKPHKLVEGLNALSRIKDGDIKVPKSAHLLKLLLDDWPKITDSFDEYLAKEEINAA